MQSSSNSLSPALNGVAPTKHPRSPSPGGPPNQDEKDFRQHLQMLKRRWLAISTVGLVAFSFFVWKTLNQQAQYEGRFRILVEPLNQPSRNLTSLTGANSAGSGEYDYDTQIQVLQSPELLDRTVKQLQPFYNRLDYGALRSGLTISRLSKTKLLEIRYRSYDSAEIRAVLEQLAKDYLAYSVNERQTDLNQGLKFVESQISTAQARVDQLQRQLQAFRQDNNLVEPDTQATRVTGQADQINQQRLTLDQEITKARIALQSLQGESGAVSALNNNGTYQGIIKQLQTLESQIALESTRLGENSTAIQDLKDKRANLLLLLRQEAEQAIGAKSAELLTQLQNLEVQKQELAQAQQSVNQRFQQLPGLSRQYTDLQRELKIATGSLERFLSTRETLQVEASQKKIPWQLMEPVPKQATLISSNPTQGLLTGVGASLALGIGAALLLEKLDSSYRTSEELGKTLKLPILGKIPRQTVLEAEGEWRLFKGKKNRTRRLENVASSPAPSIATLQSQFDDAGAEFIESLRVLRANLDRVDSDKSVRSIVVSSAKDGEGKTTIALYLAQTAAEMGQRVLLVDADFRRSQLETRLTLSRSNGLSNLVFENVSLNEVIEQPFADLPFFVLPRGATVADPIKVLASPMMPKLMHELSQAFDLIIYDAPSLSGLADAILLAPHSDGMVLVVQLGKTDQLAVRKSLENLVVSNIPVLGITANAQT